jgi:hypothetical protein
MPVFDGLALLDEVLGLSSIEACLKIRVGNRFKPGPCPKNQTQISHFRRKIARRQAQPSGRGTGYTGPRFTLDASKQAKWDNSVNDAVTAADYGNPDITVQARDKAREASEAFQATLTPDEARRFEQQKDIALKQEEWRRAAPSPDSTTQMQDKMRSALKDLWSGKKIAVRVTPGSLENILRTGRFKTVHETYRSGGSNNPKNRADLEEQLFGIDPKTSPKQERPVYGYVAVNGIRRQQRDSALGQYGPVQVILKDAVRKRTTASNGDSMTHRKTVRPSPVDAPEHWSYSVRGQQPGSYDVDGEKLASQSYAEAQIHGGVSIGDIEEVVFSREPEDRVTRRLDEKGIPRRIVKD